MRTMYDSTTATDIPRNATMVAGYLPPSQFAWSAADWARFPNAVKVRIAIFASVNDGHVLDVEPGDATPAQAPGWVVMRRRAGVDPTVYCNASTWPTVRAEFQRQRIPEPHYWIARYDGVVNIPAGAVAKQYANPAVHGRGHFDLSAVADHWPGVDPEEDDMELIDPVDWDKVNAAGPTRLGWTILNMRENARVGRENTNVLLGLVRNLQGDLDETEAAILGAISTSGGGTVDVDVLAATLAAKLGPNLGDELVAALGRALNNEGN